MQKYVTFAWIQMTRGKKATTADWESLATKRMGPWIEKLGFSKFLVASRNFDSNTEISRGLNFSKMTTPFLLCRFIVVQITYQVSNAAGFSKGKRLASMKFYEVLGGSRMSLGRLISWTQSAHGAPSSSAPREHKKNPHMTAGTKKRMGKCNGFEIWEKPSECFKILPQMRRVSTSHFHVAASEISSVCSQAWVLDPV